MLENTGSVQDWALGLQSRCRFWYFVLLWELKYCLYCSKWTKSNIHTVSVRLENTRPSFPSDSDPSELLASLCNAVFTCAWLLMPLKTWFQIVQDEMRQAFIGPRRGNAGILKYSRLNRQQLRLKVRKTTLRCCSSNARSHQQLKKRWVQLRWPLTCKVSPLTSSEQSYLYDVLHHPLLFNLF